MVDVANTVIESTLPSLQPSVDATRLNTCSVTITIRLNSTVCNDNV